MAPYPRHQSPDENNDESLSARIFDDDYVEEDGDEEEVPGKVAPDDKIEELVKELIRNSRKINGDDITVTVNHADVTLSGTVKSSDEKIFAGALAQLVHGVGVVRNDLIVKINEGILPTDIGRQESH